MFKKYVLLLGKLILAGLLAFATLTAFSLVYHNVPVHYAEKSGATDYVWEPNTLYSRGTEGFAWGKTNNEGYLNLFDYADDTTVDVLIMGSSHMEGYNIAMDQSVSSRLNEKLAGVVYNIGISGHTFLRCASNLKNAVEKYTPSRYVVIETGSILFSDEDLRKVVDGTMEEISSHSDGLLGMLQQNQYLRLVYKQLVNYLEKADTAPETASTKQTENNDLLLQQVLSSMSKIAEKSGAKIIVTYHPGTKLNSDGTLEMVETPEAVEQFKTACEKHGILFLNLKERFLLEYEQNRILPYGFSNSSVGSGHMNTHGHAMMADELYKLIKEVG